MTSLRKVREAIAVMGVHCPECSAQPYAECTGKSGHVLKRPHASRIELSKMKRL